MPATLNNDPANRLPDERGSGRIDPVFPEQYLIPSLAVRKRASAGILMVRDKIKKLNQHPSQIEKVRIDKIAQEISNSKKPSIDEKIKIAEKFLGGKGKVIKNKHGDSIIVRGDKKVRFDIKNTDGDRPHFHLEKKTSNGRWRDAGTQHRYYFEE